MGEPTVIPKNPRKCLWLLIESFLIIGGVVTEELFQTNTRQKRLFSIFNIVTFKNEACTTTGAGNQGGTCLTSTECTAKGGSASGNCAAGFGVCCLFSVGGECSGGKTISHNCTYIQNNGYPAADTTISETCEYNFERICDNLCQIRLDFNTLVTVHGAMGECGTTADAITVKSPFSSSPNAFPPTVCGILTGQHMYLETGTSGNAGSLSIAKGTDAGSRNYQIKATYLTCNNLAKAPAGCTQYFTGESGSFQSYNYQGGQLLQSMNYNHCFRQKEGYCRLQISESTSTTPDPFFLSGTTADDATKLDCGEKSYLTVSTPTHAMFCGGVLSSIATDTAPSALTTSPGHAFQVGLRSMTGDQSGKIGFNLNYKQIPCL